MSEGRYGTPVLSATDLYLEFESRRPILDGACIEVSAQEVVSVVGPSGAGKSSLLMCLCGVQRPDRGTVTIDGVSLTDVSGDERDRVRRERFGFVMQTGGLVPELDLVENVSLPLRLLGKPRGPSERSAAHGLEQLGIGQLGQRMPDEISGGELQRAAIARALIHRPLAVLADEPTGSLDDENSDRVLELLVRHAAGVGAAVIIVTHDRSLARRTQRTLTLRDGRLVA